ncbi:hypothetical protein O6H91_02G021300 [Diphasiastrum complanatum]|uniref:Uncharacterized protein n=1 Tax=Diphasiastrum complanatum TaxID=34168 RepID=A0ACC2EDU5_DIPCM|nr:hypothetical protein O6H91_02G021300 [Diphasiastrum complanatum]
MNNSNGSSSGTNSTGAPCGACKFLRRKCVKGCIFAPFFGSDQGAARFAAVHKIFGASNVSKLLHQIPSLKQRCDAVLTISYEAQARLSDPVYGCVATIFTLQQQVVSLQAELAIVQAQLASRLATAALQQQQQHYTGGISPSTFESPMANSAAISNAMSLVHSGSSGNGGGIYNRVKEETANFHGALHSFDLCMSPPLDPELSTSNHIDAALHKGSRSLNEDSEEFQALAHALLSRK